VELGAQLHARASGDVSEANPKAYRRNRPSQFRVSFEGLSVRELRVTGNAVKRTAILTGGSPTHATTMRSFPTISERYL
jgi:hypothetical protein